jgi:hypothetical protein
MNMVGRPANLQRSHFILASNPTQKRPNPVLYSGVNPRLPILRRENDMIAQRRKSIGHAEMLS